MVMNLEQRVSRLEGAYEPVDARLDDLNRAVEALRSDLNDSINSLRAEVNSRLNTLTVIMLGGWVTTILAIIGLYLAR